MIGTLRYETPLTDRLSVHLCTIGIGGARHGSGRYLRRRGVVAAAVPLPEPPELPLPVQPTGQVSHAQPALAHGGPQVRALIRLLSINFIRSSLDSQFHRLAPSGTYKVQEMLQQGGWGCVQGGFTGTFTPMWLMVARKPLK